jgi:lambda family phage tail tape measure protein
MADVVAAINQVRIVATDESGPAFDSAAARMKGLAGEAQSAASSMLASFDTASKAVQSALAGIGGGAFAVALKAAADYANQLRILSEQSGISIEKFLTLKTVFDEAGVSGEIAAKMLSKMNEAIAQSADAASKDAYVLSQMGVTSRDAADATLQLLQSVGNLRSEQDKIAVLTDIYGAKQAREMLPVLDDLIAKTIHAKETIEATGAKPSDDLVLKAKQYGVAISDADLAWHGVWNTIGEKMLPRMTELVNMGASFLKNIRDALTIQDKVAALNVQLTAAQRTGAGIIGGQGSVQIIGGPPAAAPPPPASEYEIWAARQARLAAEAKAYAAARAELIAYTTAMSAATEATDRLTSSGTSWSAQNEAQVKMLDTLNKAEMEGKGFTDAHATAMMQAAAALDAANRAAKEYTATMKDLNAEAAKELEAGKARIDLLDKATRQTEAFVATMKDLIDTSNRELNVLGLTSTQMAIAAADQKIDIDLRKELAKLDLDEYKLRSENIDGINNEAIRAIEADKSRATSAADTAKAIIEANLNAQDSFSAGWAKALLAYEDGLTGAKTAQTAFNSLTSSMETLFVNMAQHATNAWQTFKNSILTAIEQIVAKMATSGIMQLFSLGGSAGSVGGAASLIPGGGSSPFGGLFNLFGSGAGSGIFGSIGTSFTNLNLAVTAGVDSIGGFSSALMASLPALGAIGAVAAIAIPLLSGLFSKGGGPKQGGEAGLNYYASEVSPANNATIQATVDALGASYQSMLASLGGKGAASFGLGYDTDPQGTAQNRVSSSATVGGQNVYGTRDVGVGRDDAGLQAALALEAQRVVLAALKASELPADIAKLFSSIDVPTASAADIAAIEKTAATYKLINDTLSTLPADVQDHFTAMLDGTQKTADSILVVTSIIRTFGEVIDGLGPKLEALDPASLTAFIDALGGAAAATASFAYLGANFLTTAQRMAQSTATLNDDFTKLGVAAIPQTHAAFLALLNSFDLTTDAGRSMYASILDLSSLFVAVHGTADQAAGSIGAVSTALSSAAQSAQTFFQANFYTTAEQQAKKAADELAQIGAASAALGVSIPVSVAGFRTLIEGIDQSTDAGKSLYASLIVLAPAIFDLGGAASSVATSAAAATTALNAQSAAQAAVNAQLFQQSLTDIGTSVGDLAKNLSTIASTLPGDTGDKLAFQLGAVSDALKKARDAQLQADILYGPDYTHIGDQSLNSGFYTEAKLAADTLQVQNDALAAQLAHFVTLKAQYGAAIADQLIALESWYQGLHGALGNYPDAQAALDKIYAQRYSDIVNGIASGTNTVIDAMAKLRQSIADYLKTLQISTLSPLTPMQQLAVSQNAYQTDLLKAQGGDQTALGNITKDADAYLKLARDAYASSQAYTDIFNKVTSSLADLAGTDVLGQPHVVTSDPFPVLVAALPTNSKIASSEDIAALQATVSDLIAALADAGTEDSTAQISAIDRLKVAVVDAVNTGLK